VRQVKRESAPRGRFGSTTHGGTEPLAGLNARIPRQLWRRLRFHCVARECLVRDFVTEALREHLRSRQPRR